GCARCRVLGCQIRCFKSIHERLLQQDREQSEDHDIEAERGDRRMAEYLLAPDQAQDGSEGQDDDQRCHRVRDERCEQDAADHQLGKGMHHAACSTVGSTACRAAASMTMPATTSASRAGAVPANSCAISRIRCGSRDESAVRAAVTTSDPGPPATRAKPAWHIRIVAAWSKHAWASRRAAPCRGDAVFATAR